MRLTESVVRRVCCFSPGKQNIVQNVYNPHAYKLAVLMGKMQCEVVHRGLSAATGAADRGANGTILSRLHAAQYGRSPAIRHAVVSAASHTPARSKAHTSGFG